MESEMTFDVPVGANLKVTMKPADNARDNVRINIIGPKDTRITAKVSSAPSRYEITKVIQQYFADHFMASLGEHLLEIL